MKLYEFDAIWNTDDNRKLDPITIDIEKVVCYNRSTPFEDKETTSIEFISSGRYTILFDYKEFNKIMKSIEKELVHKSI